jgi:hypothetical protein
MKPISNSTVHAVPSLAKSVSPIYTKKSPEHRPHQLVLALTPWAFVIPGQAGVV